MYLLSSWPWLGRSRGSIGQGKNICTSTPYSVLLQICHDGIFGARHRSKVRGRLAADSLSRDKRGTATQFMPCMPIDVGSWQQWRGQPAMCSDRRDEDSNGDRAVILALNFVQSLVLPCMYIYVCTKGIQSSCPDPEREQDWPSGGKEPMASLPGDKSTAVGC